jgi:chromate transport protein ChrA
MSIATGVALSQVVSVASRKGGGDGVDSGRQMQAQRETLSDERPSKLSHRLVQTLRHFGDLGFTAFGGPGVHVVILRKRFVERLEWLDHTTFSDLFALGNALPGPGSTQLAFSIATVKGGTLAGLLAFLLWSLPGAIGMTGLGLGVRHFQSDLPPIVLALLTGLNASAVGLIALAAYQLSVGVITDHLTRFLVIGSASFGICYHAPWMYPTLIAIGGVATLAFDYLTPYIKRKWDRRRTQGEQMAAELPRNNDIELETLPQQLNPVIRQRRSTATSTTPLEHHQSEVQTQRQTTLRVPTRRMAIVYGIAMATAFIVCLVTRAKLRQPPRALDFTTNMMIAGLIIFGGGPVVVPLLRGYTVDNGWVTSRDFLLGFAILQAFPGPNFNYAAYLGVLSNPQNPVLGALLGFVGIFSPGLLLKLSLLPLYSTWRRLAVVKSVLRGLNAAAVGLVYTAVWQLFLVGYIYQPASGSAEQTSSSSGPLLSDPWWGVVAGWAFVLTQWCHVPAAFSIILGGIAGLVWFAVVGVRGTQGV